MGFSRLFRLFSIATISTLSAVMVSVPAQANSGLIINPSEPVFVPGGPTPAFVITSANVTIANVEKVFVQVGPGNGTPYAIKNTCTSTPSRTLSDCAVVSVKVTDNGATQDFSSAVAVSEIAGKVQIVFDTVRPQVLQAPNTRIIEVSMAEGAFNLFPTANYLALEIGFSTAPNPQGATFEQAQGKEFNYAGVSFNGGSGAVGTMNAILAPITSNLPPNSFTKSGFNFAGWSCREGGQVGYADQAVMTFNIYSCPTLYAVWTAVGSNASPSGGATTPATTTPATTTPTARLATTGTSLSAWAPALALGLGWMLVAYSRSLRASRARHLKI